uniref:FecR family protein n=1 Tax=Pedobacter schmidteae TaxID=2201271 RepID=UPI000EB355B4|nr:FecR domain-containing protein [Pedobacter schmidteae]
MNREELISLSEKILSGTATELEIKQYNTWYNAIQLEEMRTVPDEKEQVLFAAIEKRISEKQKPVVQLWRRWIVAASLTAIVAASVYFYNSSKQTNRSYYANDLTPGGNSAMLKLANGNTVPLSKTQTGITINIAELTYSDGSKLTALQGTGGREELEISTPMGGQYQVVLADGTRVWLNAGSALKFPSDFSGLQQRKVELSGEAYFEVESVMMKGEKNKKMPFIVESAGQLVEVLGTHFNVNSYGQEKDSKTTLLEGSVRIKPAVGQNVGAVLKPGEQATLAAGSIRVKTVNTEEAMAWKNGFFDFNEERLESIMEKIARWYNVTVVYQDPELKEQTFTGSISRFTNASKVLDKIALSEVVHFRIEGRNITVMK